MFKPNSKTDRLNYGNLLTPPEGYRLEQAIGTTYSLDLETLTAIAISLGLVEETDSELARNPVCMLNALQKVSDRILIFCEAGQIKLPKNASPLCLILEKMIMPVALPYDKKLKRYPSFHPKMWILDYVNDFKEHKYRFVNLSRNLTFDRSWDVAVALDGVVSDDNLIKSKPIRDFLRFLGRQIDVDYDSGSVHKKAINHMIHSLEHVSFYTDAKEFFDFTIMPLGIGREAYDITSDALFKNKFDELVIMSPFLSRSVVADFNGEEHGNGYAYRTLITRKKELEKLKADDVSGFDVFVLKDNIIDGESEISDDEQDKQLQDIHAKMYLTRKGSNTNLYVGSMNASYAAIHKNIEMLVCLNTKNRYLNAEIFLGDIFGGSWDNKKNPFELVEDFCVDSEEVVDEQQQLERVVKDICRMSGKAYITQEEDKYNLSIEFDTDKVLNHVFISPLRSNQKAEIDSVVQFHDLDMLQLSEFYVIRVVGKEQILERIIMIPTSGLPEEREKEVVNNVVKDKRTFMEYIAFVLSEDYVLSHIENRRLQQEGTYRSNKKIMPAIYEKMLKVALEDPERLAEIQYILRMIEDKDIVTDEFRKMYETFCNTLKIK